jgi:hypothetical protein
VKDLIEMAAKEPQPLHKPARGRTKAQVEKARLEGGEDNGRDPVSGMTEEEVAAERKREAKSLAKLAAFPKPACAEKALNNPKTLLRILQRAKRYQERLTVCLLQSHPCTLKVSQTPPQSSRAHECPGRNAFGSPSRHSEHVC